MDPASRNLANGNIAIHRLPNELLAEAFTHVLSSSISHHRLWESSVLTVSTTLGAVCSLWRDITLSTPSLWSIIIYDESIESSGSARPRIVKQLERSGGYPLDVIFRLDVYGRGLAESHLGLWHIITPHLTHCRSLEVQFPSIQDYLKIFPLSGDLKLLHSLGCNIPNHRLATSRPISHPVFRCTPSAPNLTHLYLTDKIPLPSNTDMSRLLTLDLDSQNQRWDDLRPLLAGAQALTRLRLSVNLQHVPSDALSRVHLPHLQYLFHLGPRPSDILDAPQLRKLTIVLWNGMSGTIHASFPLLADVTLLTKSSFEDMGTVSKWLRSQSNVVRLGLHEPDHGVIPFIVNFLAEDQTSHGIPASASHPPPTLPSPLSSHRQSHPVPSLRLLDITFGSPFNANGPTEADIPWDSLRTMRPKLRVRDLWKTRDGSLVDSTEVDKIAAQSLEWGWELRDPWSTRIAWGPKCITRKLPRLPKPALPGRGPRLK
ncbi:hypothetical protein DL93DRAFT_2229817 [Clavulina sp. PMI_390]|nr:hypothetical protein DL93DRAFT_2229817 [Clavulina sp. PMI_390]